MIGGGGLFMFLVERLRWERFRWVLLLLIAHVIFGARSGLYDTTRSLRQLRRFMNVDAIATTMGKVSVACLVLALILIIVFLSYDED